MWIRELPGTPLNKGPYPSAHTGDGVIQAGRKSHTGGIDVADGSQEWVLRGSMPLDRRNRNNQAQQRCEFVTFLLQQKGITLRLYLLLRYVMLLRLLQ